MRILLIGSGAREHAIACALKNSRHTPNIIAVGTTSNPGILRQAEEQITLPSLTDLPTILEIAQKSAPDLCIVGPEDPIAAGVADILEDIGIKTVAPLKNLARIESSKGFSRALLKKYSIDVSPKFRVFTRKNRDDIVELNKYIEQDLEGEYVVKFDSLKGGKGVKVSGEHLDSPEDGVTYALQCIEECGQVVVEEKLVGCEFSLMSFVACSPSGKVQIVHMPAVQDHKRAYEGDMGPNTGGMGTYSDADHSLPFLTKEELECAKEVNQLTAQALLEETGKPYKGILYGGYMATKDGVKVIEFNCRFGDPEALNVLAILESDFVAICQAIVYGELTEDLVKFASKATVCKYIVPKGYPEKKDQKGAIVKFPDTCLNSLLCHPECPKRVQRAKGCIEGSVTAALGMTRTARLYLGDLSQDPNGSLHIGTSRTAGIVGMGDTIEEAERFAESLCEEMEGPIRFRKDIGTKKLIQKRVDLMQKLRKE